MTDKPTAHITYCGGCGYEPRALSIAADINREFGLQVDLFKTVGGVFEIDIGEDRIFSKIKLGRFPEDGEIMHILSCKFSKPTATQSALASLQAAAAAWAAAAGNSAEAE
jgi:selT/selW/selH-like putative selenoprotein